MENSIGGRMPIDPSIAGEPDDGPDDEFKVTAEDIDDESVKQLMSRTSYTEEEARAALLSFVED